MGVPARGQAAEGFTSQLRTRFGDPSDGAAILDAGLRSGQATWGTATCPIEVRAFLQTLRTEDAGEGIQAFFQKRPADFKGR